MQRTVTILFFLLTNWVFAQQCNTYTGYAYCNDSLGYFDLYCPFSYESTVLWSNGDTSFTIHVPPGNYSATVTDTVTGFVETINLIMWHDNWDLHIADNTVNLNLNASLPYCGTNMSIGPGCSFYPNYSSSYCVLWEDNVPIDTFANVSCSSWTQQWWPPQPGRCYDLSVHDTVCNCFQATWLYNPPRTVCIPFTNVGNLNLSDLINIYPNPFHDAATFTFSSNFPSKQNSEMIIYNSLGELVRVEKIGKTNHLLHRRGMSSGLYFFRIRCEENELIPTGKFVIE